MSIWNQSRKVFLWSCVLSAVSLGGSGLAFAQDTNGVNLVENGWFERGATGWIGNSQTVLQPIAAGRTGKGMAISSKVGTKTVALDDATNTIRGLSAGKSYRAIAWVKSSKGWISGVLRVFEGAGAGAIEHRTPFYIHQSAGWTKVSLEFKTTRTGADLNYNVVAWNLPSDTKLLIDDASLYDMTVSTNTEWKEIFSSTLTKDEGWTKQEGTQANDSSYNLPENVVFDAQGMHLIGKREPKKDRAFTSADVLGKAPQMILPNYFRAEVKGKTPSDIQGVWPALLWFRPHIPGKGPDGQQPPTWDTQNDGEIDVVETFGASKALKSTLHSKYDENKDDGIPVHQMLHGQKNWSELKNSDPQAEHTYVIEKRPNSIRVWVDGVELLHKTPANVQPDLGNNSKYFNWNELFENPLQQWYPRITLQLGDGPDEHPGGTGEPDSSFQQVEMLVTSLKLYKYTGQ